MVVVSELRDAEEDNDDAPDPTIRNADGRLAPRHVDFENARWLNALPRPLRCSPADACEPAGAPRPPPTRRAPLPADGTQMAPAPPALAAVPSGRERRGFRPRLGRRATTRPRPRLGAHCSSCPARHPEPSRSRARARMDAPPKSPHPLAPADPPPPMLSPASATSLHGAAPPPRPAPPPMPARSPYRDPALLALGAVTPPLPGAGHPFPGEGALSVHGALRRRDLRLGLARRGRRPSARPAAHIRSRLFVQDVTVLACPQAEAEARAAASAPGRAVAAQRERGTAERATQEQQEREEPARRRPRAATWCVPRIRVFTRASARAYIPRRLVRRRRSGGGRRGRDHSHSPRSFRFPRATAARQHRAPRVGLQGRP
jgi:hypothetical protein